MHFTPSYYPCHCGKVFMTFQEFDVHSRTCVPRGGIFANCPTVPTIKAAAPAVMELTNAPFSTVNEEDGNIDENIPFSKRDVKNIGRCIDKMRKDSISRTKKNLYDAADLIYEEEEAEDDSDSESEDSESEDDEPPTKRRKSVSNHRNVYEEDQDSQDSLPDGIQDNALDVLESICEAAKSQDLAFTPKLFKCVVDSMEEV